MNQNAMYQLTYGLYMLSAKEEQKNNGCIINTAVQVTTSPNRITIAVNKQNFTHDMVKNTGLFNLSVLDETAPFSYFENFGYQSGRTVEKFEGVDYAASQNGLLYLPAHTVAFLSGKVVETIDLGSHSLFLADVTDGDVLSGVNPVTYSYYQANIKPKPTDSPKKGYRCKICGYVYEGDPLPDDFICPICKHGAEDFEKI